jgi:signal transduction histidine kinase
VTTPTPEEVTSERQQTDESLRLEREKADAALAAHVALFDETADAVIIRARGRADLVLAAARAKVDRKEISATGEGPAPALKRERVQEDKVLEQTRATADDVLREERAEYAAPLAAERQETDRDLDRERDRSDHTIATRDEFLAIVSHDLRNLLNGVMGFAGLMTMEMSRDKYGPEVVRDAERIQRSGARMNRLIGDLVDVASIHAGTLAVHCHEDDPTQIVTEAVETFQAQAQGRGISVKAELVAPLRASFDAPRILQVLTNLLSNAIKFTPANGKVVIRVERVGEDLKFAVSDTGRGIPADKLEAVFERYLQVDKADRRGVGLGLYISRCIVQGHGGRIWAESTLGAGSTFCFTIPAKRSGKEGEAARP